MARTHGTRSAYNAGCRCDDCRRVKREDAAARRKAKREPATHGLSGYTNSGCRCQVCVDAKREANRATRDRASDEARARAAATTDRIRAEWQAATLDSAHHHREPWTGPELELAARDDLTARQVAGMLGRSYVAVVIMRGKIRKDPRKAKAAGVVDRAAP